jgi:phosphocarrier protein
MLLAAEQGSRLELEAMGPDADAALTALASLIEARFHETDDGWAVDSSP